VSLSAERFNKRIEELRCENERVSNIIRATEMERDAADKVADNLRSEIKRLIAQHEEMLKELQ
jgi:hypothetical protein